MVAVVWVALGVGGATVLGTLVGFFFRNNIIKHSNTVNAFASGLMLVAAMSGLILPSRDDCGIFLCSVGILCGVGCLTVCDRFAKKKGSGSSTSFLLFIAIAVHNLPEGMAAGVGFGTSQYDLAVTTAVEIAIQNIPEGMVIVGPMLSEGISVPKTLILAFSTAIVEIVGAMIGYYLVGIAYALLPFTLALAGGMMLYVVIAEMIPEAVKKRREALVCVIGFLCMLFFDSIL